MTNMVEVQCQCHPWVEKEGELIGYFEANAYCPYSLQLRQEVSVSLACSRGHHVGDLFVVQDQHSSIPAHYLLNRPSYQSAILEDIP